MFYRLGAIMEKNINNVKYDFAELNEVISNSIKLIKEHNYYMFLKQDLGVLKLASAFMYFVLSKENIIEKDKSNLDLNTRYNLKMTEDEFNHLINSDKLNEVTVTSYDNQGSTQGNIIITDSIRDSIGHSCVEVDLKNGNLEIDNPMEGKGLYASIPFSWFFDYCAIGVDKMIGSKNYTYKLLLPNKKYDQLCLGNIQHKIKNQDDLNIIINKYMKNYSFNIKSENTFNVGDIKNEILSFFKDATKLTDFKVDKSFLSNYNIDESAYQNDIINLSSNGDYVDFSYFDIIMPYFKNYFESKYPLTVIDIEKEKIDAAIIDKRYNSSFNNIYNLSFSDQCVELKRRIESYLSGSQFIYNNVISIENFSELISAVENDLVFKNNNVFFIDVINSGVSSKDIFELMINNSYETITSYAMINSLLINEVLNNIHENLIITLLYVLGINNFVMNHEGCFSEVDNNSLDYFDIQVYTSSNYNDQLNIFNSKVTKFNRDYNSMKKQMKKLDMKNPGAQRFMKSLNDSRIKELKDIIELPILDDNNQKEINGNKLLRCDNTEANRIIRNCMAHPGRINMDSNYNLQLIDSDDGKVTGLVECSLDDLIKFMSQEVLTNSVVKKNKVK